jgi:predicted nuclease of predicted toxin-antitoxin system
MTCAVRTESPGIGDRDVLASAQADTRVVVTFDKDFSELAFRFGLPADCEVILFRVVLSSPRRVSQVALAALGSRDDWPGSFVVVGCGVEFHPPA